MLVGSSGSHQKWRNPVTEKQVIVPHHRGRILPLGTMRAIIEGSGLGLMACSSELVFDKPAPQNVPSEIFSCASASSLLPQCRKP